MNTASHLTSAATPKSLVILISGRGSNLQAMIQAKLCGRIACVISNRPEAEGLEIARCNGIPTVVIDHRGYPSREAFDSALAELIDRQGDDGKPPDLVILAGFMRILGDAFVEHYKGRLLNIHPSLLPAFPGLHTHAQALAAGVRIHGCTVHFVMPSLDRGPIVAQAAVPVFPEDDESSLANRVLSCEHIIYPRAVRWFLEGRLSLSSDGRVRHAAEQACPMNCDIAHEATLCVPLTG